jgi:Undecaprenyl-phosphate glucose phosphotransferase
MSTIPSPDFESAPALGRRPRLRLTPGAVAGFARGFDLAVIVLVALAARAAPAEAPASLFWFAVACAGVVALDLFAAAGLYRSRELGRPAAQAGGVVLAWSAVMALLLALAEATGSTEELGRSFFLAWWAGALAVLVAGHAALAAFVARGQRAGWLATRLVLVGAGPQAARLVRHIRRQEPGVRVLGIYDDRRTRVPPAVEGCPVLGTLADLTAFARAEPLDQVIIALPQHAASRRLACFEQLRHLPVDIRLSPDLPELEPGTRGVAEIAGLPLLRVFDRPLSGWAWLAKGFEDRLLAALVLLLAAPLMLAIAVLIRLDSTGPVFYRQQRYGFDSRPIRVLKFRTMHHESCDPPEGEIVAARPNDPRVTPVGRILRRTSLDELPQFLNVLLGEMSIVGPRPHASAQNERFAALIDGYLARHRVKPGITGLAQVNGLRGEAGTLARMQERVRYDLHYIENWSLLLDLRIIFRTLLVGFSHPNAY